MTDLTALSAKLNYSFKQPALIEQALTHASALQRNQKGTSYERLEFLGDRVLGIVVAEWLYEAYPDAPEGILASQFAALVGRETLSSIARDLDLGAYLQRAKNDVQGARGEATMLSDALEAIFAAIYLDGGLAAAKPIIRTLFADYFTAQKLAPRDPKTALQEWAQGRGYPVPSYSIVSRSGPSHAPEFEVELVVKGQQPVYAKGASKQEAEKAAAAALLQTIS